MPELPRHTRISSYTLVTRDRHILLCRLSAQLGTDEGKWTLPGGGLDFGEHPEDGAIRETLEETGFQVEIEGLANVHTEVFRYEDREVAALRFVYWARVVGGEQRHELDGSTDLCQWIELSQIKDHKLVPLAGLGVDLALSLE